MNAKNAQIKCTINDDELVISGDYIVSFNNSKRIILGGDYTSCGACTFSVFSSVFDSVSNIDNSNIYSIINSLKNSDMRVKFVIGGKEINCVYYINNIELSDIDFRILTISGVDAIGALYDDLKFIYMIFSTTSSSKFIAKGEIQKILNSDYANYPSRGIQVKIQDFELSEAVEKPFFVNINEITKRDIIRTFAEAMNRVVFIDDSTIYINRSNIPNFNTKELTIDNAIMDSIEYTDNEYTGVSVEYFEAVRAQTKTKVGETTITLTGYKQYVSIKLDDIIDIGGSFGTSASDGVQIITTTGTITSITANSLSVGFYIQGQAGEQATIVVMGYVYDISNTKKLFKGKGGNVKEISGNPFIQNQTDAQRVLDYQYDMFVNKQTLTAETHGFELSEDTDYDELVAEMNVNDDHFAFSAGVVTGMNYEISARDSKCNIEAHEIPPN